MPRLTKVLIANRGEIVTRIARSCREAGLQTVAVFSDADDSAPFVTACDQAVRIGGVSSAESYLVVDKIIDAARLTGADAIHPGFGFLSENPALPRACREAGLTFIGPSAEVMEKLGSKVMAKSLAEAAGVPVIPGGGEVGAQSTAELLAVADEVGLPILLKASAGGGGKGMRVVRDHAALEESIDAARREAESSFGDPTLLVERYIERPRHIEIQILADDHGHVLHLGERECSIQRRHQKVIEEAPSPAVSAELRQRMGEAAVSLAREVGYRSAGTVEFIVDPAGAFYFLEVNTRLQVEHPVTELVTGIDIVREQLRVAEGKALSVQATPPLRGHAIECRLYAEDPDQGFLPQSGTLADFAIPDVPGLRVDHALASGIEVPPHYDPMLAKVVTWGEDRDEAAARMTRALEELSAVGLPTNQRFLHRCLQHPQFLAGALHTHFIDEHEGELLALETDPQRLCRAVLLAALWERADPGRQRPAAAIPLGFSNSPLPAPVDRYRAGEVTVAVALTGTGPGAEARYLVGEGPPTGDETVLGVRRHRRLGSWLEMETDDGLHSRARVVAVDRRRFVIGLGEVVELERLPRFPEPGGEAEPGALVAPMPAKVVKLLVEVGQAVEAGAPIAVLEAMKMEHQVVADRAGPVEAVPVAEGDQLEVGQVIAVIGEA